jgi:predicted O-methyltransferase YrrM
MFPFGKIIERHSQKNGLIQAQRTLLGWRVTVNGFEESSPYMDGVWRKSLKKIPQEAKIGRVLFLGFGIGRNIRRLRRRFPEAEIVSVEWDEAMVQLAKELGTYPKDDKFILNIGDASEVVQTLAGPFDLILFDLYHGGDAMCASDPRFLQRLSDLLSPNGFLLFNVFKQPNLLATIDRLFSRTKTWRYWWNTIALYRPFSLGLIGAPLPDGYRNSRAIKPHVIRNNGGKARIIEQTNDSFGMRFKQLFWTETYLTDEEPTLDPEAPRRLVIWQPLTRQVAPKGWWRAWINMHMNRTGFAEIKDPEHYWKAWSKHAQRHRLKWEKEEDMEIVSIDYAPFSNAYKRWSKFWFLNSMYVDMLRKKEERHGRRMHYLVGRKKSTGEIVAGFAFNDVPEGSQSIHVISFIRKKFARKTSVGVGLMDEWFKHAVKNNIRFLDFDLFWAPGESPTWKGFSRFKGQFVTRYIDYPRPFLRIAGKGKS